MEPLIETPLVPSDRDAVRGWRSLDRQTRQRLLAGEPAPSPTVAALAVGYARTSLSRSNRHIKISLFTLAFPLGALAVGVGSRPFIGPIAFTVMATFVVLVWVGILLSLRRRTVGLLRVDNVNSARLWADESPASAPAPVPYPSSSTVRGETFAACYSRRKLMALLGRQLIPLALIQVAWLMPETRSGALVVTDVSVGFLVMNIVVGLRRTRRSRPALVMDNAGVSLPKYRLQIPWSTITEIRVSTVRTGQSRRSQFDVVAFLVTDPERLMAQFPKLGRRAARSIAAHGTPAVVTDKGLDQTVADIVAAATELTSTPVRYVPG
ncbi:MAG TPA: hypothetical protein VG317_00820 [Pseudonocardiaceae bacterium]|jgi:hypothetical protein|nr:hypothetical protein [Pseudonocardiaceae bacterium]